MMHTGQGKIFVLTIGLLLFARLMMAQTGEIKVGPELNGLTWNDFVTRMENQHGIRFYYIPDSLKGLTIRIAEDTRMDKMLRELIKDLQIEVTYDKKGNIFLSPGEPILTSLPGDFSGSTGSFVNTADTNNQNQKTEDFLTIRKEYVAREVILGNKKAGMSESICMIRGVVRNLSDSTPLISATLYFEELRKGTTTDEKGSYSYNLPKGKYTLVVSSLESKTEKFVLSVLSGDKFDIYLEPKLFMLDEFVVSTGKDHNVKGSQMGFEKLAVRKINEIPVVLGEKDIIKVTLLLPGVQTVGEGSTGFNVRGSPADQNMFYLNSVPVYNSSHLFGFFSAFNSDAISEFSLLKSNIPVRFGGRLSSIFDVVSKTGNLSHFHATGGVSPVTAKLMAEGPFIKDKASYMLGLRSTYSDWLFRFVEEPELRQSKAWFGDAVTNLYFKMGTSDDIRLLTYYSHDEAEIAGLTVNSYDNAGASLQWNHRLHEKHSLGLTMATGRYTFKEEETEFEQYASRQSWDLYHHELRTELVLRPVKEHTITAGISSVLYLIRPGDYMPLGENSLIQPTEFEQEKGLESGIYLGEAWTISPKLEISGGLRYNKYAWLGPRTTYSYFEGQPRTVESIADTLIYAYNEIISTYDGLDYRLALRYLINDELSVKAAYNKLHQYIFMLSNTIAISPTDEWKLCDNNIRPMTGDQISLGLYRNFLGGAFEASVEGYYKYVRNLVEYKDGAELSVSKHPEVNIVQGNMKAYGVEFMIKKPLGTINGWFNYTWSGTQVTVNNPATGERNNLGLPYPANYDKPHSLNIVANWRLSKRFSFSGNAVYSTGRPITYPTAIYYQDGHKIIHYSTRNEYRLPDYFRMDVSLNIEGNLKKKKIAHGSWSLSVYNLTGRRNAYSVYFRSDEGTINGYRLSIFGSQIYSISYNFKLGNYEN